MTATEHVRKAFEEFASQVWIMSLDDIFAKFSDEQIAAALYENGKPDVALREHASEYEARNVIAQIRAEWFVDNAKADAPATKPVCAMTHEELADFIVGEWMKVHADIDVSLAIGLQTLCVLNAGPPPIVTERREDWERFPELSTDDLAAAFRRARHERVEQEGKAAVGVPLWGNPPCPVCGETWAHRTDCLLGQETSEVSAMWRRDLVTPEQVGHHLNMNEPPFRPCPVCGGALVHGPNCALNQPTEGRNDG